VTGGVAVVVLNWNGGSDTLRCLRSLRRHDPGVRIVVVDNGSTDGSLEDVEREDLADDVVAAGANLGYAGGNNLGLTRALADGWPVVAVLNNDTFIQGPVFSALAAEVTADPHLVLSPLIRYAETTHGQDVWFQGGVLDRGYPRHVQPDELARWPVTEGRRTAEVLTGCCIVASAQTWREVGRFDDGMFLLFEDSDWSMRAVAAGRRLAVRTDVEIHHAVGGSVTSARTARLMSFYFGRNMLRFSHRYFPGAMPRLVWQWFVVPALRSLAGREPRADVGFRWLGAACGLVGQSGVAPRWVQSVAAYRSGRVE
jgi:GT2 family glycosyltransferase